MRKIFIIALLFVCNNLFAQDAIEYQTPPKEIIAVVGVRAIGKAALASPTTGRLVKNKYLSV